MPKANQSRAQAALEHAAESLAVEANEAAHILQLVNRRLAAKLKDEEISTRDLVQIRKAMNSSAKNIAPTLNSLTIHAEALRKMGGFIKLDDE